MTEVLAEMFHYDFLIRACVVGLLTALCASLLGVSLVLKRYAMIGDGLAHVGFGALAVASVLNAAPLAVAVPVVILAAFLLLRLNTRSGIRGDTAIALLSTGSLAVGVMVISLNSGMNADVCNYLFGSILAMSKSDVYLSIGLSILVLILFSLFYHAIFLVTFDEIFARAVWARAEFCNMLLALLTALVIVLGMRIMGALLITSLIIFPAVTSMRLCKTFRGVTLCAAVLSVSCFFCGLVLSYHYALPTGASIAAVNILALASFSLAGTLRGRLSGRRA